ncbi:peroxiredoxin [Streptomyces sulfonofaciens]|uniref:thioredoxin-dependent peroxiredoxin n=1 Tax=Streptomyces sulfonofaciens TaxID=68272 RepID=A0A919GI72_9ACTN|nr:peroxiredoxin family protein [Streptomyces sulfonofaciens]GHH85039.1 peroxiredoxin [Streptomyces sulfonofaciens]
MTRAPEVGAAAPDFALPGLLLSSDAVRRREYRLADAKGRPLVLVFYPGDGTMVCTKQLCSYTSELDRFKDLGADVWAVSPQDLDSHEKFARKHGLAFPLLYDEGQAVAAAFGIRAPGVGPRRSVFVLDGDGVVRWRHIALVGLTFRSTDTLVEQLALLRDGR